MTVPEEGVWAYLFQRGEKFILAIWSPKGSKEVSVPVGEGKSLEVVDLMGNAAELPNRGGAVTLTVNGSPQYLMQVMPGIFSNVKSGGDH